MTMTEAEMVAEMVTSCTRCELHKQCKGPVAFTGPVPAEIAVVGEAPGDHEDEARLPFVGPPGHMIRGALRDSGIDPASVFFCNTVSCFPHAAPSDDAVTACRINKRAQLDLADPKFVLLLGKVALHAFVPDFPIGKARARPFQPEGASYVCFATYHPAAALRKGAYELEMRDDLHAFKRLVAAGFDKWPLSVPDTCVLCREMAVWFGASGLGVCEKHMPDEGHARMEFVRNDYHQATQRLAAR